MHVQLHKDQLAPPKGVQAACRRGLELRPKYGGDGLTDAAVSRARSMASGKAVSADTLKRIKAYHARHTYEKQSSPPSPGYVAYLLWGGQAGKTWANTKADNVEKAAKKKGKKNLVGGNKGAWAHAKEQAKGKKDPDAYAAAVFRNITKKSVVKSEGNRGGHVIGHTRSGKPIYASKKGFKGSAKAFGSEHADFSGVYRVPALHGNSDDFVVPLKGGFTARHHQEPEELASGGNSAPHTVSSWTVHAPSGEQVSHKLGNSFLSHPDAKQIENDHDLDAEENIYQEKLHRSVEKSASGAGSRGGHIIGHTKSGKPIYSAHHDMNRVRSKTALHASHELIGYTRADHADAASRHMRAYQKVSGTKPNRAMAHLKLAAGHSGIATGKDLMRPVKQPKAEMSGMTSSYENHKGLAAFHLREGDMKTKVAPEEALWHYAQAGLHSDKAITMRQRTN